MTKPWIISNILKNDAKELVRKIVEGDKNVFISRSSKAS